MSATLADVALYLRRLGHDQPPAPTLSTLRAPQFLADYGVAIAAGPLAGLAARAVVVIDENDQVVYSQLVNEITEEPDYDAALASLKG